MVTGTSRSDVRPAHQGGLIPTAAIAASGIALMALVLFTAGRSGGTLADPVGARLWAIAMWAVAVAFLTIGVVQSFRKRKLSRVFLMTVASASAFWQETYGDWGSYLLYSPRFARYGWGETIWTSPVRCWWFIAGYVFFYVSFFLALEKAFYVVKDRWPNSNPYMTTTIVSFPMFYLFDLIVEGAAHGFGWWHYQFAFGPTIAVGDGHFPLVWPILEQVPFMALVVFAATWRNSNGEDIFQLLARKVVKRRPGQLAILASWIVTLNVTFLLTTILPLMALRWLAGPASLTIP